MAMTLISTLIKSARKLPQELYELLTWDRSHKMPPLTKNKLVSHSSSTKLRRCCGDSLAKAS